MNKQRPSFGASTIELRDYFEALRNSDQAHWREMLAALDVRLTERFETQEKGISTALTSAEKAVNAALASSDRAVEKAEQAQALRNIVSNEFRNTLSDQAATFWPIKEGQSALVNVTDRFNEALAAARRERIAQSEAEDKRISALERSQAVSLGRVQAISGMWGVATVIISVGITLALRFTGH